MVKKKQDSGRILLKGKKKDSDGCLQTMAASSSAAAVVVENDSTKKPKNKGPRREKTRAEKDKHNKQCQESRLRGKKKKENMIAELERMKEERERMQLELQELKSQKISDEEKISQLESDVQALRSVLQRKEEEIGRLNQSPSKWPFKELGERGIGNAEQLQDFLFSEYHHKQDGQYAEAKWKATGFMTEIEQLCPDEPDVSNPLDFIVEPDTIEGNAGVNDSVAGSPTLLSSLDHLTLGPSQGCLKLLF